MLRAASLRAHIPRRRLAPSATHVQSVAFGRARAEYASPSRGDTQARGRGRRLPGDGGRCRELCYLMKQMPACLFGLMGTAISRTLDEEVAERDRSAGSRSVQGGEEEGP